MFQWIVGNVDINSAFVLVAMFVTACVVLTALIVKRRRREEISNDFELAKLKESDAHAFNLAQSARVEKIEIAQIMAKREIEFKRIDGNAIEHTVKDVRDQ